MSTNYIVYKVYNPQGEHVKTFLTRKAAKTYIQKRNANIPSWHYAELYKMECAVERK